MKGVQAFKITPVHSDARRDLIELVNGNFIAKQIKLLNIHQDSILGNHYHPYRQFFYMLSGEAVYTFENIHTKQRITFNVYQDDLIIIDKDIAHKAEHKSGNIMIEGNEEAYTSPEVDDLKYIIND